VLRQPARELTVEELQSDRWQRFIDDLIETMRHARGAGLAANQVGEPVRICVIEVSGGNPRYPYKPEIPLTVLVNPLLKPVGDQVFSNYEGCLSVPDLRGMVMRHRQLSVTYLDRAGQRHTRMAQDLSAGTYQHECDHLDGKLFVDRVADPQTLCTWDNFRKHHEADFLRMLHSEKLIPQDN